MGGRTLSRLPEDGCCEYSGASRDRAAKGLIKVGDTGVVGLMGLIGLKGILSGMLGCVREDIWRAQSCREYVSSPGRNHNVVGPDSLVVVSPAVRLDLRLRSLSVVGSGEIWMMRVGRTGPCFRCAIS